MTRSIHTHQQGSQEWLQHRSRIFNASEAPVVMGASKYITRSELLRQKSTGIAPEVNAATQALFDRGHAVEAPTVAMIEDIIGDSLAPVVASIEIDGLTLGASYDGLSMLDDTACEIKLWNEELAKQIRSGEIEPHYYFQLEQQFIVTPSLERIIFATSDGTPERFVHMEYRPVAGRREQLIAGWKQFATDLANYKPEQVAAPVVAAPVESLPAVSVRVDGSLAVVSNLPKFGEMLRAFIAKIPATPSTDQEFADTDAACKALKKAEEALEAAEAGALGQIASVEEMTRMVADLRNLARTTRLASEKMVEARKTQIRTEQVQRGKDALAEHVAAMNARLGKPYMPAIAADFAGAIRGKKTVQSLKDGIDTELARAKIEASAIADRIQANLTTLRELAGNHVFLFADTPQIVLKANDDLTALVKSRIAEHEAAEAKRLEAERERIRAEEAARLEREQAEREAAERRQQEEAARRQREEQEYTPATAPASLQPPVANVVQIMRQPAPTTSTTPTLKLGQIGERLGFSLTGEFLKNLGFEPAARDKAALLFHESQFPLICMRLVAHINHVQAKQAA